MIKQLLEEVRQTELDEPSRERLSEIYETSITELSSALSPGPAAGARAPRPPVRADTGVPSTAELRIAKAQLVGWLEGLFHGIQATLFAQQMAARQQLEQMRSASCRPGPSARHAGPGRRGRARRPAPGHLPLSDRGVLTGR